ncbi:hypothetical protein IMCC3317_21500 [Kordia antarctica]|uniref:Peptidase M56 domain-containing protein n=1 Tax=Kordia antarctica TaxID=1218801 RepID=A0A7L4ZJR6_9FLAO|nr:hypothetical protein [Kordia antarctica]QHI36780.1 hypothetical protein IMCC3317_21500 [Kordia antarctica]
MTVAMVFVSKYLVPRGFRGLTLYPFIFLREAKDKSDAVLIHHEKIHLRQQSELLVLPFYVLYILEWIIRFCYYRNIYVAYRTLSFEKEAYRNETDFEYLKNRKWFQFLRYL